MFLIDIKYKQVMSVVEEYTVAHRAWLDEQYSLGNLLCSGPKVPRSGGILIARVASLAAAEELIRQDPFYQHEIADYTITEFLASKKVAELRGFAE